MNAALHIVRSNGWRDHFNPLRGLALSRIVGLLEAGERGDYPDLQWFYHFMERSDEVIQAAIQRRIAAAIRLDWEVLESEDADRALREDQAALLRHAYNQLDNLRDATKFLATGLFRGYAHLEKHYGEDGLPVALEPVEQWFWTRQGMMGDWRYLPDATASRHNAVPIERDDFLIFETVALNRALAPLFFRKAMAQKNWDSWLEVFGIPSTFLIGPPGVTPEKEADYLAIAQELISDGRGYLPNGSDIKFVEGSASGGRPPFQEVCEYLNKQIVLTATGGHLTMLAEQGGGGYYTAGAQQDGFAQVAVADAGLMAEVFQRDFDAPLLAQAFPGRPVCAYFSFRPSVTRDPSQVVNTALLLAGMGYRIDPAQLSERIGMKIEAAAPMGGGMAGERLGGQAP